MNIGRALSLGSLVLGVLLLVGAVSGVLYGGKTAISDAGMMSVSVILVLLGLVGLWTPKQATA